MDTDKIIVALTIFVSLFIFDAVFIGIIFFVRRKVAQAATWPATLGSVTLSTIQMRRGSKGGTTAYPVVNYSYQVNGQPYRSSKVMPGPDVGGSGAHKVVQRYPAGAQVMVYYNPQDPSDALLERGTPGYLKWFWIILVISDLFMCTLAAVLFFTL